MQSSQGQNKQHLSQISSGSILLPEGDGRAPCTAVTPVPTTAITDQLFQLHGKGRRGVFPRAPLWLRAWYSLVHSSWSLKDPSSHCAPSGPTVLQLQTGSRRHHLQPCVLASLSCQGRTYKGSLPAPWWPLSRGARGGAAAQMTPPGNSSSQSHLLTMPTQGTPHLNQAALSF